MAKGEELMARVCAGDAAAFEALVEQYWPVAERVAQGIVKDAQLAQDVAQDVFADIYVQRARYQPRFSFHAYVAAIARHKSIDALRRRGEHPAAMDERVSGAQTPESAFIEDMYRHALLAQVERLPGPQRRILVAYALEGKSYRDVAAEMRISVAQVKIALYRIRKSLRRFRDDWQD